MNLSEEKTKLEVEKERLEKQYHDTSVNLKIVNAKLKKISKMIEEAKDVLSSNDFNNGATQIIEIKQPPHEVRGISEW